MHKLLRLAISAGISLAILALMLHLVAGGLDQASRPRILQLLARTSRDMVALFFLLQLAQLLLRAWRYRVLVFAAGEKEVPRMRHMVLVTGVRNMLVDLLPARIGELSYVAMLNRGYRVSAEACLSSLSVAVAFDFLALLLVALAIAVEQVASAGLEGWIVAAIGFTAVTTAIALASLFFLLPRFASWVARREFAPRNRFTRWMLSLLHDLSGAMVTTRHSGQLLKVLLISVAVRICKYGSLYLLFRGVTDSSFPGIAAQGAQKIIGALIGGEIGASLPIPAFMSFGIYEAGGTLVSAMLGLNQKEAFFSLLTVHIWSQLADYSIGALCLVIFVFIYRQERSPAGRTGRMLRRGGAVAALLVLGAGAVMLAQEYRTSTKLGAVNAPPAGQSVVADFAGDRTGTKQLLAGNGVNGFMVWSSNRGGNHDIYRMSLPAMTIEPVTWHPHAEFYPRISPDGRRIVFARSQQPWVSQRNTVSWDVYLLDLYSGEEKLLARHATHPAWVDNDTVSVLQNAVQVATIDVATLKSTVIYESGNGNSMPPGAGIHTPSYNGAAGILAFTGRQSEIGMQTGFWGTALLDDQARLRGIHDGCEITWSRDGTYLFQVGHGGKQKTRFFRIDATTGEARPWLDLPGEFSHEYFPINSSDGRWLIFGASTGGHEHDTADYEMFIWKIGSPAETAARLTFHTGNDNWPDIHIQERP